MHFNQLDLNLLVALDALLTERNITEAGRRVHLTQSAMSGALSRLREFFGDELLVQVGRKMVLTPLGASLVVPVRDILMQIRTTLSTRPGFDPATSRRRFSLMMSDYVCTVLMPEVLRRAEAQAPNIGFEVLWNDVSNPFEILERAEVDFLIMPQEFLAKEHPSDVLYSDGYACLVSSDNPHVSEVLTVEQYLALGHVVLQYSRARVASIDQWFLNKQGVTRRVEVLAGNFNAMPQLVVGTHRIATVQRRLAEFYAQYLPLRIVQPPFDLPTITEAVQWHNQLDNDPGIQWLRGLLKEAARRVEPVVGTG
jgi:DNA-binding transcriptional LysR family regulator